MRVGKGRRDKGWGRVQKKGGEGGGGWSSQYVDQSFVQESNEKSRQIERNRQGKNISDP